MRELKFRVYDKHRNKFIDDFAIKQNGKVLINESWPDGDNVCYAFERDQEMFVVQQFTGLKDSAGKEIFEGDIVYDRVDCNVLNKTMGFFTVEHDEEHSAFVLKPYNSDGFNWIRNVSHHGKVVGNIFENPDFLKIKI